MKEPAEEYKDEEMNGEVEEPPEEVKDEEMSREGEKDEISCYEQLREQRIRENLERLQELGVMDLTRNLNSDCVTMASAKRKRGRPRQNKVKEDMNGETTMTAAKRKRGRPRKDEVITRNPPPKKPSLPSSDPSRRSSRLVNVARVSYNYWLLKEKKESEESEGIENYVEEGSVPEIYTEEHLKLLGDCKTPWTLYNSSCHQCRQKTGGHRTNCSSCSIGSFCGDCLYTGYGENVLEANKKTNWICPKCRGICNCDCCRKEKGWKPTGDIYSKVSKLGFKSVAHYLIQTRQSEPNPEDLVDEDQFPTSESPAANPKTNHSQDHAMDTGSGGVLNIQSDDRKNADETGEANDNDD